MKLMVVQEKSVDREREFIALLNLGGLSADACKMAFRAKLMEIIRFDESAEPIRKILGRTQDKRQVEEWYLQLGVSFLGGGEMLGFAGMKKLAAVLKPRLSFLQLDEGLAKSDEERVK